jgi:hypothetical protein
MGRTADLGESLEVFRIPRGLPVDHSFRDRRDAELVERRGIDVPAESTTENGGADPR